MSPTTPASQSSFHTEWSLELPISPEATTSRVLVNNATLRVVAFAMDAGQELTEHSSPRAVVVQQIEGTMRFRAGDAEQTLRPGDLVYLAPGERHALVAETACRFTLVLIVLPD
jgi:quercetin dioxygenase-like cupin family protein